MAMAKPINEKVFYQGNDVNAALGIAVMGNKVIVSASPNVFVFTDTDGDDKADKKEVLFTGIGRRATRSCACTLLRLARMANCILTLATTANKLKIKTAKPIIDREGNEVADNGKPYRQGMVFRCNPDGSDV